MFNKNKILNDLINLNTKHTSIDNVIDEFIKINTEDIEDIIDRKSIKKFVLDQYHMYHSAYSPNNNQHRKDIFESMFSEEDKYELKNIYNVLYELTKFDKLVMIDSQPYFIKLMSMLYIIYSHLEKIELLEILNQKENHLDKGMALSKNPDRKITVDRRINDIKNVQKISPSNTNDTLIVIMNEYNNNSLETDYMLYQVARARQFNMVIDESQLDVFYNCRNYLNASELIEDRHIFESARIYCYSFFKQDTLLNQMLKINEAPNNTKLAEYTNTIMTHFFEEYNNNLSYKHIKKNTQTKSTFFDLELLEYRTSKSYKPHPVFND